MRKIFFILTLALSFNSFSQARLGYTYSEIREEFSRMYEFTTGYDEKLGKYLQYKTPTSIVSYYFDSQNACYTMLLLPLGKVELSTYIEKYNNLYVIESDTSWKIYSNGSICHIELMYADDGGYFFLFY